LILIVDDDLSFTQTLRLLLSGPVEVAQTAGRGLLLAQAKRPGIVLLDVHFPFGPSGLDVVDGIARTGATVVVMTVDPTPEGRVAAFSAGAAGYVNKAELGVLLEAIQAIRRLSARRASSGSPRRTMG
jgi:DNA-binding response OmpR family regulator